MMKKLVEFLRLMVRKYPFTLAIGAIILLVSIPYNLLLPPEQYCGNWPGWAAQYMHLTAAFNIGCEASLTNLWAEDGAVRFVGNFTFVLLLMALVEYALNPIGGKLKRNVFVAAITASYLLELSSYGLSNTLSVGTSIIGVSMFLVLIGWSAYKGWKMRHSFLKSSFCFASAIFLSIITFFMYSAENPTGHALGGLFFIVFMAMYLKYPNWWEETLSLLHHIGVRFLQFRK